MDLDILSQIARFFLGGKTATDTEIVDEVAETTGKERKAIRKHIEIAEHLDAIDRLNPPKKQ